MQALRLNEVLTRVVAWHNRHPLAQRIQSGQVHSIGEVVLPFASAVAQPDSAAPAGLPTLRGLRDAPPTGLAAQAGPTPLAGSDAASAVAPQVDAAAAATGAALPPVTETATATATATADETDAKPDLALGLALDLDMTPEAETDGDADAPAPQQDPFALAEADRAAADLAAADQAAGDPPTPTSPPPQPMPAEPAQGHADLSLPLAAPPPDAPGPPASTAAPAAPSATAALAAPPPGWLARLLARLAGRRAGLRAGLRKLPHLHATFSRNFIWPLSPGRVARWARAHGQTQPVAPPDWPRREVDFDERLRAAAQQRGLAHAVHLHLLTAAIGVGDRRIRVLIGADGAILGPRAYSRPRLAGTAGAAGAAGVLVFALLGSGWGSLTPTPGALHDSLAAAAPGPPAPASAPDDTASAPDAVPAAPGAVAAAPVQSEPAHTGSNRPAIPQSLHHASPQAVAETETGTDPGTNTEPTPAATLTAAADTASAPIARIKPVLSDDERQAARQQAAALRATPASAAPPTAAAPPGAETAKTAQTAHTAQTAQTASVFAVVTRARRQHQSAVADLALLRSAGKRLSGPLPEHGELVQSQGEWRAAWWPFTTLADAERARVLLAGRGLKAEVVAF